MPRMNRGKTKRLSIRLSQTAQERIKNAADNLSVSRASMIMYALGEQFEKGITQQQLLTLENKIVLQDNHLAISVPKHLSEKIERYTTDFDFKKNVFVGLLVSGYFEDLSPDNQVIQKKESDEDQVEDEADSENEKKKRKNQNLTLPIHPLLKEKVNELAEEKFFTKSFIVARAIEQGRFKGIPDLPSAERELLSYTLPEDTYKQAVKQADLLGVSLHFYIESCVYNVFASGNKLFELESK
ncbi:hypothetical protein [Priestia megaterium]|uniref:hypothetical protein n=1 Tax=Priestia megaterium TaxID=1404 RepID=UPI002783470B|nr:hypothetical protein [Priestia megaterium]MDQ0808046.1 putative DNA-binding protein [Priestia megaterium]